MKRFLVFNLILGFLVSLPFMALSQSVTDNFNVPGPWSDLERTTVSVPKVSDGSIQLDAAVSSAEYGGFEAVNVTPLENAWILGWPADRQTDGPDDTSFDFYLAHDNDNFYIGVMVRDDIVTSDDPNTAFWRDDAVELLFDVENWKFDQNYDSSDPLPALGGHPYFNYEGRFSNWDDENDTYNDRFNFSPGIKDENGEYNRTWTYGEDGDVFGFGQEVEGGWALEMRISKASLTLDSGIVLDDGYMMGFNIGVDDDDQNGTGPNGNGSRTQDLELQYFWASRQYAVGWNAAERDLELDAGVSEEELKADRFWLDPDRTFYDLIQNDDGRLKAGGAGDIIFEPGETTINTWSVF